MTCTLLRLFSSVIVLGFDYLTLKFPIISIAVIIRIVVVVGFVLESWTIIIIRLFKCT